MSLFSIPLTMTIDLVIAETTLFVYAGVKRAEPNYSSCFKLIYLLSSPNSPFGEYQFYLMSFTGSLLQMQIH